MSGTIEYVPENGGSLPSSVVTIVQPSAKRIYISSGNIEKLVSIAAILYTILMRSIKGDASPVYSIRSDNYVQVGQTLQSNHCPNCFATNHTIDVCIRPCTKYANRNPSKPLHAAKDCPQIRSQPAINTIKTTSKQPNDNKRPVFGSEEHEQLVRKQIKKQLVNQIKAGEEISASSSDSDSADQVNYIRARNFNGAFSESDTD
jgi:hypothetical protein